LTSAGFAYKGEPLKFRVVLVSCIDEIGMEAEVVVVMGWEVSGRGGSGREVEGGAVEVVMGGGREGWSEREVLPPQAEDVDCRVRRYEMLTHNSAT